MSNKKIHTLIACNNASQDFGHLYDKLDELTGEWPDRVVGTDTGKSTLKIAIDPNEIIFSINEEVVNKAHSRIQEFGAQVHSLDDDLEEHAEFPQYVIDADDFADWTSKALEEAFDCHYPTLLIRMGERFMEEAYNESDEEAPEEIAGMFLKMLEGNEQFLPEVVRIMKSKIKK